MKYYRSPWGLSLKDLESAPDAKERYEFVVAYCAARNWPTDPARLTVAQLQEVIAAWEQQGGPQHGP